MAEDRLEEIRARAQVATEGPWEARDGRLVWTLHGGFHEEFQILKAPKANTPYAEYWPGPADGEFIERSREDVDWLIAEVDRLRGIVQYGRMGDRDALEVLGDMKAERDKVVDLLKDMARRASELRREAREWYVEAYAAVQFLRYGTDKQVREYRKDAAEAAFPRVLHRPGTKMPPVPRTMAELEALENRPEGA